MIDQVVLSPLDTIKYTDQLLIYSALLFESYYPFTDTWYQLRQAQTKKIFFEGYFHPEYTYDWEYDLGALVDYWNGDLSLQKTSDLKKCKTCLFSDFCKTK